jgi:hypothetical protein
LVWSKGVTVVKPIPTPTTSPTPTPTATPEIILFPASVDTIEACRAPDKRTTITEAGAQLAIAYPITKNIFPFKGSIDISILGIDFPDVQGIGSPSTIYLDEMRKVDEWLKWYSNDQFRINWHFKDKWFRMPKVSETYNWVHEGNSGIQNLSTKEIAEEFIKAGENDVDFTGAEVGLFIFPQQIESIQDSLGNYISSINTKTLNNHKMLVLTTSTWFYNPKNEQVLWGWLTHEILHYLGIAGHSPRNPYLFGLEENQGGISLALNGWDSLILDWLKPSDIYCVDKKNLKSVDMTLVPLEREQLGIRSAMIRLSETRVLVVESHRPEKWSHGMLPTFQGVMVYIVDTSNDTDRTGEMINGGNGDDGSGKIWTKTAYYLTIPGVNHPDYFKPSSDTSWGQQFSQNIVMLQGESLLYDGVKISLIKSGKNDTVRIEKAE